MSRALNFAADAAGQLSLLFLFYDIPVRAGVSWYDVFPAAVMLASFGTYNARAAARRG